MCQLGNISKHKKNWKNDNDTSPCSARKPQWCLVSFCFCFGPPNERVNLTSLLPKTHSNFRTRLKITTDMWPVKMTCQFHFSWVKIGFAWEVTIHESRNSTAHPSDAFCVGIKISISMESIEMEILIPSQNASFGCAVEFRDSCIIHW